VVREHGYHLSSAPTDFARAFDTVYEGFRAKKRRLARQLGTPTASKRSPRRNDRWSGERLFVGSPVVDGFVVGGIWNSYTSESDDLEAS
jgi:hypothetical protein